MPIVQKIAVLVNENARQGKAAAIWQQARGAILANLFPSTEELRFTEPPNIESCLRELIASGVNCFISAGGDGSVNTLLNGLMALRGRGAPPFFIGGIGLGSSNDFLKPFGGKIEGLPVRIDIQNARLADVGSVVFENENSGTIQQFFIANASLGVTAAANYYFNHPGFLLKKLKQNWTGGAIILAALRTIMCWKNEPIRLIINEKGENVLLSNLAIIKNPHVSGDFKYDQSIEQDDGWLGLNYCVGMNKIELLKTLADLSKGRFHDRPKRFSLMVKQLSIQADKLLALETDGEVQLAKNIHFEIVPKAVYLLGNGFSTLNSTL